MEWSALNELKDKIEGVLWLENFVKFHGILVIKLSHDLNFLYETLLSILLTVSGLFGERLYRIVQMVIKFLD